MPAKVDSTEYFVVDPTEDWGRSTNIEAILKIIFVVFSHICISAFFSRPAECFYAWLQTEKQIYLDNIPQRIWETRFIFLKSFILLIISPFWMPL